MNPDETDQLKRLTLIALFSDDELVDRLVLKGGNALSIAYDLTARASFDLDFSMEGEFEPTDLPNIRERIEFRLRQAFKPLGYAVFDVRLEAKPENISPDLQGFWGGYALEFRFISQRRYDELSGNLEAIRRQAIPSRPGGKARFEIDISRHECCAGKRPIEIDQFTVYVYTPTMILCEKIRAICQQMPSYASFVRRHQTPRARDFFDIHAVVYDLGIDVRNTKTHQFLRNMFDAKRVPLDLLLSVTQTREFHRNGWDAVVATVDPRHQLRDFDFYFDFVEHLCREFAKVLID